MVAFTIRVNKSGIEDLLKSLPREEIPFTTALALTRTAQSSKDAQIQEIRRVFDRPTRFTLNSLFTVRAEKNRLSASVSFKDSIGGRSADKYLQFQVEGGPRRPTGFEVFLRAKGILGRNQYAIAGRDAKLDSSGNISRGQLNTIVQGLSGNDRRVFVDHDDSGKPTGILSKVGKGAVVRILVVFVRQPNYDRRYRFFEVAQEHADRTFPGEFVKAFSRVMKERGASAA